MVQRLIVNSVQRTEISKNEKPFESSRKPNHCCENVAFNNFHDINLPEYNYRQKTNDSQRRSSSASCRHCSFTQAARHSSVSFKWDRMDRLTWAGSLARSGKASRDRRPKEPAGPRSSPPPNNRPILKRHIAPRICHCSNHYTRVCFFSRF